MNKKEALTQLEIMATNATGRLGEAKSEEERALLSKEIEALNMAMDALKDYKPKTGHWICPTTRDDIVNKDLPYGRWKHERLPSTSGGTYAVVRCSVCECQYPMTETNYCPNCGAKMEMGVDPNNCRKCELANECDLHICIKGVRKRMSERSEDGKE